MYKLLQDINCPGTFVPQGTIGEKQGSVIVFGGFSYTMEFIRKSPDWFEEVPKWTDEDMLKFGEFMYKRFTGYVLPQDVKKMFDDFLE